MFLPRNRFPSLPEELTWSPTGPLPVQPACESFPSDEPPNSSSMIKPPLIRTIFISLLFISQPLDSPPPPLPEACFLSYFSPFGPFFCQQPFCRIVSPLFFICSPPSDFFEFNLSSGMIFLQLKAPPLFNLVQIILIPPVWLARFHDRGPSFSIYLMEYLFFLLPSGSLDEICQALSLQPCCSFRISSFLGKDAGGSPFSAPPRFGTPSLPDIPFPLRLCRPVLPKFPSYLLHSSCAVVLY